MSGTMKNKILLSGAPIAWLFKITEDSGNVEGLELVASFDNLGSSAISAIVAGATTTTGTFITVTRADGATIQFPADALTIDGTDETQVVDESGGTDASGKGTFTLTTNEAPIEFDSMTAFLGWLKANKDEKFLLITTTGYTYERMGTGNAKGVDGFVYSFVKLTSNIDLTSGNAPIAPVLTFASQKHTSYTGDLTTAADPHPFDNNGIKVKRGGASYDIAATVNVPLELTSAEQDDLEAGEVIFKENPAA